MRKTVLLFLAAFTTTTIAFSQKPQPTNATMVAMGTPEPIASYTRNKETNNNLQPSDVLKKLKEGNQRFVNGKMKQRNLNGQVKFTAESQNPYAIIVSCIDSRVIAELLFDQGIGDMFEARVAGNFVNTDIIGGLEFGCAGNYYSKVIVVLGHSNCDIIKGACDHAELGNLTATLSNIKPALDNKINCCGYNHTSKNYELVASIAKENVILNIKKIRVQSPILKDLESKGSLKIVGAMYDLETGKVTWLNESETK